MDCKTRCAIAALLVLSLPACADEFDTPFDLGYDGHPVRNRPGFHAVERLGFTLGGDAISKITHADGTIREIVAGGLYQVGIGALYQWHSAPVSASLTINYHYDSDYNNNDNASFRRVPLEALAYFNGLDPFRIGAGMRYVYSARATSNINGVSERYAFENAHGSIVEIGYQVRAYGWVNLRYVKESYRVASYSTSGAAPAPAAFAPYDGSHVGLFISYEY